MVAEQINQTSVFFKLAKKHLASATFFENTCFDIESPEHIDNTILELFRKSGLFQLNEDNDAVIIVSLEHDEDPVYLFTDL